MAFELKVADDEEEVLEDELIFRLNPQVLYNSLWKIARFNEKACFKAKPYCPGSYIVSALSDFALNGNILGVIKAKLVVITFPVEGLELVFHELWNLKVLLF